MSRDEQTEAASCRCGQVQFTIEGAPIMHVACYCTSCRTAGLAFDAATDAPPVLADDGSTDVVLYRKDRVKLVCGGDKLREDRLQPDTTTRRMVATCCASPIFMEFEKGHWVSFYRQAVTGPLPPLEMRVMTMDRLPGVTLADDIPTHAKWSGGFMWKLLSSWVAMGFRNPQVLG